MTLLDRLLLIAGFVVFIWQVVIPMWSGKKLFPDVRKWYNKRFKKKTETKKG